MPKYDDLDARTELEQTISGDMRSALKKRGLMVVHNGTSTNNAPSGVPDILATNETLVLAIECTTGRGAQQDRELNETRAHLNSLKRQNPGKKCYAIFVSENTSMRMIDGILDHNNQRAAEGKSDLKIIPLCFNSLELWLSRLSESEAELYPTTAFLGIFDHYSDFVDDFRVRRLLFENVFPNDIQLGVTIEQEEVQRDQKTLESLIRDLGQLEDYMRESGIAVGRETIDSLIYLVFLKLYEEKREKHGDTNRLRSNTIFEKYRRDSVDPSTRRRKRAIHKLFGDVKREGEFMQSRMFTASDTLPESLKDDFIISHIIPTFSKYRFIGTRIDALGAVYERLAAGADKDVRVGQFFTPEAVVRFMVALADLDYRDLVLDPACGTGRFLIHAMADMVSKVEKLETRDKDTEFEQVTLHRLFGVDIDPRISKIAKMNMWVHGDGKSNIFGGPDYNGLALNKHGFNSHETFDGVFDAVLTNPPLGELNYQDVRFVDRAKDEQEKIRTIMERMPSLPQRNLTKTKLNECREKAVQLRNEIGVLEAELRELENDAEIKEWNKLGNARENRERRRQLEETDKLRTYKKAHAALERKKRNLDRKQHEGDALLSAPPKFEITGNTMKGGALFLTAIWHYIKENAYPNNLPEWRGGKMLIILDEGILNTQDYTEVRTFLRRHFYLKAVISLTSETFVPISKTSSKTSILYAVKKTDLDAVQKEPIFFAHVERVGLDTRGKVCANHFDPILRRYHDFKQKVLSSYSGSEFRKDRFEQEGFQSGRIVV